MQFALDTCLSFAVFADARAAYGPKGLGSLGTGTRY